MKELSVCTELPVIKIFKKIEIMPLKYFDEKKKKANKWDTIVRNAV